MAVGIACALLELQLIAPDPDGKQGFSIGIALPKMIVAEGSGKYVILVYGVLFGILLPWTVGKWWYGTQRLTKEKVLRTSASKLFQEYDENMTDGDLVNALSSGAEYDEVFSGAKADSGLGKIEQSLFKEDSEGSSSSKIALKDQEKMKSYDGVRRKAAALLWTYLERLQLDGGVLDDGKTDERQVFAVLTIKQRSMRLLRSHTSY